MGQQYTNEGSRTYVSGEALAKWSRVKLSGSRIVAAGAGVTDLAAVIGVVMVEVHEADEVVPVLLLNKQGTLPMIAAGIIGVGAPVYGAASGKVSASVSGDAIGYAEDAAGADGDIIEIRPVYH